MTVYGFHSLRHSFASFCAEAGVPKATLLSILGTESEIADKYYTHVSDESQWKAIEAISGKTASSAQVRNEQVDKHRIPVPAFCQQNGIGRIEDLSMSDAQDIIAELKTN